MGGMGHPGYLDDARPIPERQLYIPTPQEVENPPFRPGGTPAEGLWLARDALGAPPFTCLCIPPHRAFPGGRGQPGPNSKSNGVISFPQFLRPNPTPGIARGVLGHVAQMRSIGASMSLPPMQHTIQGPSNDEVAQEVCSPIGNVEVWVERASRTFETSTWEPAADNKRVLVYA